MSVDQIGGFVFFCVSVLCCIIGYVGYITSPDNWELHKKIVKKLFTDGHSVDRICICLDLSAVIVLRYLREDDNTNKLLRDRGRGEPYT